MTRMCDTLEHWNDRQKKIEKQKTTIREKNLMNKENSKDLKINE